MSDEIKKIENETCFCKSEGVKNFLIVSLGTFVGGFCAISLFSALNKPPVFIPMHPMMGGHHNGIHKMHHNFKHGHFKHHKDCNCHKEILQKHLEKKAEFVKKMKENKD